MAGKGAYETFQNEGGGHRWQRVPPTEKRGRVQTSTVTVAVLNPDTTRESDLRMEDIEVRTTRGSGPGGQNRNKVENCVVVTHKPTGETVRVDSKSQSQNKILALKILKSRLDERARETSLQAQNSIRHAQIGAGMRGDKRRTYRVKDDIIQDHITNQSWKYSQWIRGNW